MIPSQPRCWYLAKNKQVLGPFFFEQLRQMAMAGMVERDDVVLPEGHQKWRQASTIEGLFPPVSRDNDEDAADGDSVLEAIPAEFPVAEEAVLNNFDLEISVGPKCYSGGELDLVGGDEDSCSLGEEDDETAEPRP